MTPDYRQRCQTFSQWLASNQQKISALLDEGSFEKAAAVMHQHLEPVIGQAIFRLYKPAAEKRYILEFNAGSDGSKFVLFKYLCDQMDPCLKGLWNFNYYHHAYKGVLEYKQRQFDGHAMKVSVSVDKKRKRFDVDFSNQKHFAGFVPADTYTVLFLLLQDYIGELATEAYIGRIGLLTRLGRLLHQGQIMALDELDSYMLNACAASSWTLPKDITLVADSYETAARSNEVRKDIYQGTSYCLDLLNDQQQANHYKTAYVISCGVGYYSLVFKRTVGNNAADQALRDTMERRLTELLAGQGAVVNSARGRHYEYLDYFLFDQTLQPQVEKLIYDYDKKFQCVDLQKEFGSLD